MAGRKDLPGRRFYTEFTKQGLRGQHDTEAGTEGRERREVFKRPHIKEILMRYLSQAASAALRPFLQGAGMGPTARSTLVDTSCVSARRLC